MVLIEGDKIKAVGGTDLAIPSGAKVIDATGKFLVPGLIDAHVHLVHRLNFAHITGDEILPLFLAHGVTSVLPTVITAPLAEEVADQPLVLAATYVGHRNAAHSPLD